MLDEMSRLFADLADILGETGRRLTMTGDEVAANSHLSTEDGEALTSVAIFWGVALAPLIARTSDLIVDINMILVKLADAFPFQINL